MLPSARVVTNAGNRAPHTGISLIARKVPGATATAPLPEECGMASRSGAALERRAFVPAAERLRPQVFTFNIPRLLSATENVRRIGVLALPFFAPFELTSKAQKVGLAVFGAGLVIYCLSWLPLIAAPASRWSNSAIGFLAPAYTPLVWLLGLALLMRHLHWPSPYRWWFYVVLSIGFLGAHIGHAALVFARVST